MTPVLEPILKGVKVAIVDDEPDAVELVATLLEMHGATVISASDGQEGLALIRQERPRFVLSDVSMPGMSGDEMLSDLKADRVTAHIPIIALTAHALSGDREWALAQGFHAYLAKPFVSETFISDVLAMLANVMPEFTAHSGRA